MCHESREAGLCPERTAARKAGREGQTARTDARAQFSRQVGQKGSIQGLLEVAVHPGERRNVEAVGTIEHLVGDPTAPPGLQVLDLQMQHVRLDAACAERRERQTDLTRPSERGEPGHETGQAQGVVSRRHEPLDLPAWTHSVRRRMHRQLSQHRSLSVNRPLPYGELVELPCWNRHQGHAV